MFTKVLIANRGEIAVRIVRACQDLGIATVTLFDASDRGSLHVRLADECVLLQSEAGYVDQQEILRIAHETGAQAIHPGYGFLAERPEFISACEAAGITFIGPSSAVVTTLSDKIATLDTAQDAGFAVPRHSPMSFGAGDISSLKSEAARLGYPLVVKSWRGGRGCGTRLVRSPDELETIVGRAQAEAHAIFGDRRLYLEYAIMPSRYIEVPVLGDMHGALLHLGERDGSLQRNNQKIVEEAPAPYLTSTQREQLWRTALAIAQLFHCHNACTVEFLLEATGTAYFTGIKPRIQVAHPVAEMRFLVDEVREQIRIAAGDPLDLRQADLLPRGHAMQFRINAEDPWNHSLPSPGRLELFRLPSGPGVRVDTYAYSGCDVPVRYDSLLAKLIVWAEDRESCLLRARRALEDFAISGVQTNLPLILRALDDENFVRGDYTTEFCHRPLLIAHASGRELRDMAAAAAIAFVLRNHMSRPTTPDRLASGWYRDSRRLPD
jgi:acetyl-CoA carboxylase, biotin carboxylase subunit